MNRAEFQKLNSNKKQDAMLKISAAYPQFKFLNLANSHAASIALRRAFLILRGANSFLSPGTSRSLAGMTLPF